MAAALTSFVLKQDVNATVLASTNAVENNFLQIPVAIAAVLPEVIAAAKVSWEVYSLTHEEELEYYKQEICKVVAEKTGYSQETVSTVFDYAMPVISITQGLKSIFRKAPALLKKLPANRNVSPEVQKGSGSPQTSQGPPVVTTIAKKSKESVKDGRAGKQRRLKELAKDVRLGSADRGWLKQEEKSIERKSSKMGRDGSLKPQKYIRVPPGKELAHKRGKAAKDGNSYEHSDLQDIDLHKLQHKHEGYK